MKAAYFTMMLVMLAVACPAASTNLVGSLMPAPRPPALNGPIWRPNGKLITACRAKWGKDQIAWRPYQIFLDDLSGRGVLTFSFAVFHNLKRIWQYVSFTCEDVMPDFCKLMEADYARFPHLILDYPLECYA